MKYVYLDQNKWILLAKEWYLGKGELHDLVVKIKEKIKLGEMRIVLSLVNVHEALKQHDKKRRNELLDFMIDLSNGYTISPYSNEINEFEVHNALARKVGLRECSLQNMVFGRGLPGIMGKIPSIRGNLSEEIKKNCIEKVYSIKSMGDLLKNEDLRRKFYLQSKPDTELLKKLEEARRNERSNPDKELTNKRVMVRFMLDFILEPLAKFATKYRLSRESFSPGDSKEELISFFQGMPSLYCFYCLNDSRDRDLSKKIEHHDLNDLFSFSIAIPYCNVVFGEKRFVALAKQSKLDKLYKTVITSSLDEFKEAIFF